MCVQVRLDGMADGKTASLREHLTRDILAAGAIALADEEGLEAVTIRRLAQLHGVTPTALYWHFKDKDELFGAMAEQLFAEVAAPEDSAAPWPDRLRANLQALLTVLRPHPAVAPLLPPRVLASRAGLAVAERILALLREAGLSAEHTAEVGGYLLGAVVTMIAAEPGREHPREGEAREDAIRVKRASLTALPPRHFPTVVACADALAECASPDTYYAFSLDMLVAGVSRIAEPA
jgi:TetR/AcrR family transcriptional regulator, tetracycline repressor protein